MKKGLEVSDDSDGRLFNILQNSLHRDCMDFVSHGEVRGLLNRINPVMLIGKVVMTKDLVT